MMQSMAPAAGTEAEAWETLIAALRLKDVERRGQCWTAPACVPALSSLVEHVTQSPCNALLRLDKPGHIANRSSALKQPSKSALA